MKPAAAKWPSAAPLTAPAASLWRRLRLWVQRVTCLHEREHYIKTISGEVCRRCRDCGQRRVQAPWE